MAVFGAPNVEVEANQDAHRLAPLTPVFGPVHDPLLRSQARGVVGGHQAVARNRAAIECIEDETLPPLNRQALGLVVGFRRGKVQPDIAATLVHDEPFGHEGKQALAGTDFVD